MMMVTAVVVKSSTVEGLKLERNESVVSLTADHGRLLVGVASRVFEAGVPSAEGKEHSFVKVLAPDGVTATPLRRGVLRKVVPVRDGLAILRVLAEGGASSIVTELTVVDRGGAERVVYSDKQDLTGVFEGEQGEWVLFGRTKAFVTTSGTHEKWAPLHVGGLEPGESMSGMVSLNSEEYLAVTESRLLRIARSSGALVSAEIVGRYPYPVRLVSERRPWLVREEQDRQELLLVEGDGSLRSVKVFGGLRVRAVSSTAESAFVVASGGDRNVHSRHLWRISLASDPRPVRLAKLPEDAMHVVPWRDGLAVATPAQLVFISGVEAK